VSDLPGRLTLEGVGIGSVRSTGSAGAHLGHAAGDSKGQPRSLMDPSTWQLTCANAFTLDPARHHAVYGMQGVRGSNPLSSPPHLAGNHYGPGRQRPPERSQSPAIG
jgi:hypothetical protein